MQSRTLTTALAIAALTGLGAAAPANAGHDSNPSAQVASYGYALSAVQADTVPNSQAWGSTRVMALPNGKVQVVVEAWGLSPELPHAMHLHGVDGGTDMGCPGPDADGGDGIVSVPDGAPFYGGILASLTTTGDTTAASALALDRFPVADASGHLSYNRTFDNALALANAGNAQVVVHGIDINADGAYDFGAGPSPLAPGAPLEAVVPVLCGGIAN